MVPAEAGIQSIQVVTGDLDSGFHGGDDLYEFINLHLEYTVTPSLSTDSLSLLSLMIRNPYLTAS